MTPGGGPVESTLSLVSATSDPTPRRPLKEYCLFEQEIWTNPEICNNCFARLKDIAPIWKEAYPLHVRSALDSIAFLAESGSIGQDITDHNKYGSIQTARGRVMCDDCGSVGGLSQPGDSSKRELLRYLDRVIARLSEQGYTQVDESRMRDIAHRAKERDRLQGFDREILGLAVKYGVKDTHHS